MAPSVQAFPTGHWAHRNTMNTKAKGTLKIKDWDEKPFKKLPRGGKLTRASVTQKLAGDIEGVSHVEYLMAYRDKKSATFSGIQHVKGRVGKHTGSFALEVTGTFENGVAKGKWAVLPGLASGGLRDLRGAGAFKAPMGGEASFTFSYDFAAE